MLERGISYGSLLPGFGFDGDLGECDHDRAPELSSSTSFLAHCPVSALYAARWAGHLALARHQATLVGMPLAGNSTDQARPRVGFGFWRRMAYMRKLIAKYRCGTHADATTRHDCPAAARQALLPWAQGRQPWNEAASLHSTGAHAYLQQRYGAQGADQTVTAMALHAALMLAARSHAMRTTSEPSAAELQP